MFDIFTANLLFWEITAPKHPKELVLPTTFT